MNTLPATSAHSPHFLSLIPHLLPKTRHWTCTPSLTDLQPSPGALVMSPFATIRRSIWTLRQFGPSRLAPERLRQLQEERFRQLLRHAVERSPFYREKY